jgi:hypothetical protein
MKRTLLLSLGSLSLLLAACGSGGGAGSSGLANKTPKEILSTAVAAATKSGSVHFELLGKEGGNTETITGDSSNTDGREIISAGQVNIEAEVIGHGAYVKGNSGGLQSEMDLSATNAATYAGKWISIASTDAPFSSITKAVSLSGTLGELKPSGKLTRTAKTTKASQAVIGVHGGLPGGATNGTTGSAVLYVATSQPNVPIVFDVTESSGTTKETDVGTFTKWGQKLHLVAPTNTVAYASLPAS